MPLDKATLKTAINDLQDELFANAGGLTTAQAADRFATGLSDAIDDFVKSGDGIYQAGRLTAGATVVTAVGILPAIKIT
jgi:hypothetical protein